MEITVNVDKVDLNSIVGEHTVERPDHMDDGYSREPQTLGQAIADKVALDLMRSSEWRGVRAEVMKVRDDEIRKTAREIARPIVESAIDEPIQSTNTFGEATGTTTTLRELIVKEARAFLGERSDYGRGSTAIQKYIAAEVEKAIKKELADAIAEEKARVVAAVRAKAADLIAQAVKEGIGR